MFWVACLLLCLAIFSLWIKKAFWIWGILLGCSLAFVQSSKQLSSYGLISLFLAIFFFWMLTFSIKGLLRFAFVCLSLFLSAVLFSCLAPGVPLCRDLFHVSVNYSKILLCLPILGFSLSLLDYKALRSFFTSKYFVLCILGSICLTILGCFLHPGAFSWHLSSSLFLSLGIYTLASIIPEEALLRGFLQKELLPWLGKGSVSHILVCFISAGSFSLFHLGWISDLSLFAFTFLSGCMYAALYQMTKTIEVPICCRFISNILFASFLPWKSLL